MERAFWRAHRTRASRLNSPHKVVHIGARHVTELLLENELRFETTQARTPPSSSQAALRLGAVEHVAAGGQSSAFLQRDGRRVFVCGANSDGQLGLAHYVDQFTPAPHAPFDLDLDDDTLQHF